MLIPPCEIIEFNTYYIWFYSSAPPPYLFSLSARLEGEGEEEDCTDADDECDDDAAIISPGGVSADRQRQIEEAVRDTATSATPGAAAPVVDGTESDEQEEEGLGKVRRRNIVVVVETLN